MLPNSRVADLRVLPSLLLFGFTWQSLNGFSFLVAGSLAGHVDRAFMLMLFAGALLVLANDHRRAIAIAAQAWPFLLLIMFCLLSVAWADHPGYAFRRAAFLIVGAVVALAISAGFQPLHRLHGAILAALLLILAANLSAALVWPSFAFSADGFRGLHSSKNLAGITGMVAFGCSAAYALGAKRPGGVLVGVAAAFLSLAFLLATDSKTSMGLAILTVLVGTGLVIAWTAGPYLGIAACALLAGLISASIFAAACAGWGWSEVLTLVFGDPTFSARTDIWRLVSEAIADRPLIGFGYGSYWDVGFEDDPLQQLPAGGWLGQIQLGVINQAHNGYLDLAVQIGVPAAIFATVMIALWLALAIWTATSPNSRSVGRGLLLFQCFILMQFVLHNMMESSYLSRMIGFGNFTLIFVFLVGRLHNQGRSYRLDVQSVLAPRPS